MGAEWFELAAETGESGAPGAGAIAIVVAAIGALGVLATAFGPVLVERVKSRHTLPQPQPAALVPTMAGGVVSQVDHHVADMWDMVEEQVADLRTQRDAAQSEVSELRAQLRAAELRLARFEGGYGR